jgi:ABC-2 type transport system ATP-binding protein
MASPVIEFIDLTKEYRARTLRRRTYRALNELTLNVYAGEVFGFLGPNGAGKTTTIKLLLSFLRPTSGMALLYGQPTRLPAARRLLGYLPETASYPEFLTARETVQFYARLSGLAGRHVRDRTTAALATVGLRADADRLLRHFSKGMLQRVGLAQALVHEPTCLVLDEPASGLDPLGRRELREILVELRRQGLTIFFSSHELSEVEAICDSIAVLHRGRLVAHGALDRLVMDVARYRSRAEALEAFFVDTIRRHEHV